MAGAPFGFAQGKLALTQFLLQRDLVRDELHIECDLAFQRKIAVAFELAGAPFGCAQGNLECCQFFLHVGFALRGLIQNAFE